MNFTRFFKQFFGFLVLAFSMSGLLVSTNVQAAQCKGLAKSKCESATDCSWVKSYTTNKGAKVDAYCRAKPSKSSKKSSGAEKTSTKKADKKDTKKSKSTEKSENKSNKKKKETKESSSKSEKTDKKKSASKTEKTDKKADKK